MDQERPKRHRRCANRITTSCGAPRPAKQPVRRCWQQAKRDSHLAELGSCWHRKQPWSHLPWQTWRVTGAHG
jgi:hypothetical protein